MTAHICKGTINSTYHPTNIIMGQVHGWNCSTKHVCPNFLTIFHNLQLSKPESINLHQSLHLNKKILPDKWRNGKTYLCLATYISVDYAANLEVWSACNKIGNTRNVGDSRCILPLSTPQCSQHAIFNTLQELIRKLSRFSNHKYIILPTTA